MTAETVSKHGDHRAEFTCKTLSHSENIRKVHTCRPHSSGYSLDPCGKLSLRPEEAD